LTKGVVRSVTEPILTSDMIRYCCSENVTRSMWLKLWVHNTTGNRWFRGLVFYLWLNTNLAVMADLRNGDLTSFIVFLPIGYSSPIQLALDLLRKSPMRPKCINLFGKLYVRVEPIQGLILKSTSYWSRKFQYFFSIHQLQRMIKCDPNSCTSSHPWWIPEFSWLNETIETYGKSIGCHNFEGFV